MYLLKQIWKLKNELIWIVVSSLIPFLWFKGGEVLLGHDSGFRLNFIEHLKNLTYSWNPFTNLGIDWSLYFGFIPIQLPETIFSLITGSLSFGQRLTFMLYFAGTGASMYIFARYFFPDKKYIPLRIIAPFFYTVNYFLIDAWTIAERAKFSLYIALPVFMVLFHKTIRNELSLIRGAIYTAFLFTVLNGGGSPPLYGSVIVAGFLYLVYVFLLPNGISRDRVLKYILVTGLFTVCLNAYWIIPQMKLATSSYGNALQDRGGIEGLIAWEGEVSKHASFANLIRLQGFPDWYGNAEHPYANAVLNNPVLIVISWVPILIIVSGFLFLRLRDTAKREKEILVALILIAAAGLFFAMGSHKPTGVVYVYLMRYVPGFAMFRSSFFKFAPLVFFPIIVMFGFYVSQFLTKIKGTDLQKNRIRAIVTIGAILMLGIYHFPAFTGNMFGLKWGFSTKVSVPEYVTSMSSHIHTLTTPGDRILVLPPLDSGFINSPIDTYTWGYYSLDILPRILINRSFLANDSNDNGLTKLLYAQLFRGDETSFLRLSKALGVRYILWRGDARLTDLTSTKLPLSTWESNLATMSSVQELAQESLWSLYNIGESPPSPSVVAYGVVNVVRTDAVDVGHLLANSIESDNSPIVSVRSVDEVAGSVPVNDYYAQVECFYCKDHEFEKLVESVRLPGYKQYRLNFLNDRQRSKEARAIADAKNTPQEIDAHLSITANRLSAYKATNSESFLTECKDHLDRALIILTGMKHGRVKDAYANRVLGYLKAFDREMAGTAIHSYLLSKLTEVESLSWKSEQSKYHFGVTVDSDGTYTLLTSTTRTYAPVGYVDGKPFKLTEPMVLTAGYHRVELEVIDASDTTDAIISPVFFVQNIGNKKQEAPKITFSQVDPTRYRVQIVDASNPFVLSLNQRYSNGWGVFADNKWHPYAHFEINGFANSWVIPKTGSYELIIQYMPQSGATNGRIVSLISLGVSMSILILLRRKI